MPEGFFPLDLKDILEDTAPGFDLYIRHEKTGKLVLYRSRDLQFTPDVAATLHRNQHRVLYVPNDQIEKYELYLEQHLTAIAQNESLPVERRSLIVYNTSSRIMESVFNEPRASEAIRRSHAVIAPTVSLILQGEAATRNLIALTSHDYYTYTHSVNVCIFSVALAEKIFQGEGRKKLERLGSGFLLHDIGKREIPADIINKDGPLSQEEWKIMRRHPYLGHQILDKTGNLTEEAAIIAYQHHERYDGSGYPKRLKGEEIHIYAKICCIADTFDALTTKRSYRKPNSSFEALQIMQNEMLGNFDRIFFNSFVGLFGPRG